MQLEVIKKLVKKSTHILKTSLLLLCFLVATGFDMAGEVKNALLLQLSSLRLLLSRVKYVGNEKKLHYGASGSRRKVGILRGRGVYNKKEEYTEI